MYAPSPKKKSQKKKRNRNSLPWLMCVANQAYSQKELFSILMNKSNHCFCFKSTIRSKVTAGRIFFLEKSQWCSVISASSSTFKVTVCSSKLQHTRQEKLQRGKDSLFFFFEQPSERFATKCKEDMLLFSSYIHFCGKSRHKQIVCVLFLEVHCKPCQEHTKVQQKGGK